MRRGGRSLDARLRRSALGLAFPVARGALGGISAAKLRAAALALRAAVSFTSATLVAVVASSVTCTLDVMLWSARRRFGAGLGLGFGRGLSDGG
jgi:hypothetical protein